MYWAQQNYDQGPIWAHNQGVLTSALRTPDVVDHRALHSIAFYSQVACMAVSTMHDGCMHEHTLL